MILKELRFLTDENIDEEVIVYLRDQGFNVFDIKEAALFRLSDRAILELALQEQRVVISQDSDFGTLVFRDGTPFFGIIYLRPGHESPSFHLSTLASLIESNPMLEPPFILVAENTGELVRIRVRNQV